MTTYRYKPKLHPIKVIKDWQGEDWDVYEEYKTGIGQIIYKGRAYSTTRGSYACILTSELADFIRKKSRQEVMQQLNFSGIKVSRLRKELNIQRGKSSLNHQWAIQHKDELLGDGFEDLYQQYGLSKEQVGSYARYLRCYAKVQKPHPQRIENKRWLLANRDVITNSNMTMQQIAEQLKTTKEKIVIARKQLKRLAALSG
jgi:hypothetical protein